jgi:hypothetical protein
VIVLFGIAVVANTAIRYCLLTGLYSTFIELKESKFKNNSLHNNSSANIKPLSNTTPILK